MRGALVTIFVMAATSCGFAAETVTVGVGRVWVVEAGGTIGTVVVGDPSIADVVVDGQESIVLFGKRAGETDLVVLDTAQSQLIRTRVVVGPQKDSGIVTVRRPTEGGLQEETWVCSETCARVGGGAP